MDQGGPPRVAVVIEDDADMRVLLEAVLVRSGFQTVLTGTGEEGVEAVREHAPLVTTLDVNMPGMDGFAAARRIREFSSTYLIMLTGLDDEVDVVQGLEAGADDYLVKPFRPRELRARIETVLRRPRRRDGVPDGPPDLVAGPDGTSAQHPARQVATATVEQQADPGDGWLRHGRLALDAATRQVLLDDVPVELTRTEFDLLASLMGTGRRVRSKADLVLTVRGEDHVSSYFVSEADKRAIEVHMANLRRKLGDSSGAPTWIETVRGVGYRMT